ncbi:MAG: exopolysaccharide biosynthesis polyprenyl glycosylphosphotransferase [Calditrichaceae bacterium]|nr:exopolysaccharide biosynthesis polyprenyl glycosylphosphotransferase [Calditrichaceae bacterium]
MKLVIQKNTKNALIVGWNIDALTLYDRLIEVPALGYHVKGFVKPSGSEVRNHYKNVPVIDSLEKVADAVSVFEIDELLIILGSGEKQYLSETISLANRLNLEYRIVSDTFIEEYNHVIRDVIKEVWHPQDFSIRRLLDFVSALILLILLLPLLVIVAAVIKLESSGPIFYSQQRLGKNGKVFAVHKFRSMVQDAEKKSGPVWAQKNDPRITRIGKIMRKTRIDELPQLFNIIKGEMSFIGPRPERPFFSNEFRKKIPMYMNRLRVKPGVTGLAQVTVGYDETIEDVREKIARDLEYIGSADSWKMNLNILYKTFFTVIMGEGQ